MRFGIVIPTYLYADERVVWAQRSLASLARTEEIDHTPDIMFVVKRGIVPFRGILPDGGFSGIANPLVMREPEDAQGGCAALCWGFDQLLKCFSDITHVMFLGDDFVYHPSWLRQQQELIQRHPDAVSWYVYRSSNTRYHRTIREEGPDCLVTNISGPGCFSRAEWIQWGQKYRDYPRADGMTMDIAHERERPGERWVTRASYIQQIGVRGRHNNAGECDEALEFVGENCNVAVEAA